MTGEQRFDGTCEAAGAMEGRLPGQAGDERLPTVIHGTLADNEVYAARTRLCDLGYLRVPYERSDGQPGYRCPAEPVAIYLRKGGAAEDTVGRRCLCNGLVATIGLAQRRTDETAEPALITLGQNLDFLPELVAAAGTCFSAADVLAYLLQR